ncbi:MAG: fibronectin type III domain-containing protein [Ilumatobacteraceae bacterium]
MHSVPKYLVRAAGSVAVAVSLVFVGQTGVLQAVGGSASATMNLVNGVTLLRDGSTVNNNGVVKVGLGGLLKEGTGNRELNINLDPDMKYNSGSAVAPEGWTIQYQANNSGTWVNSEPSPANTVTDVRAMKSVTAGPIVGYSQQYTTETVAPIPASTFTGSTGGDGWDVFLYDNYVYNIFHHNGSEIRLNCLLRTTGTLCPGYAPTVEASASADGSQFSGYVTSNRSGGWADMASGKLYAFTAQSSGSRYPGALCIDVTATRPVSCGFIQLGNSTVLNYAYLSNAEGIGGRLFGVETIGMKLLCLDPVTGAACSNSPVSLLGTAGANGSWAHVYPLGNKVFVTSDSHLSCYESSTLAACAGAWPVSYTSISQTAAAFPPVAHMNSTGAIDGVCMRTFCLKLDGSLPSPAWVNPHSITPWAASGNGSAANYGRFEATDGRAFMHTVLSNAEVYCFDYSTNAACAGFDTTPDNYTSRYALRADPNNPSCVWWNSDPGRIGIFDTRTGAPNCTGNPVITLQPSSFAPRYTCTSNDSVDEWKQLRLASVAGTGTAGSIALTVRDANGNAVAGWVDKPVSVGTPLNMTGLDVAQSTSRPTFNFRFSNVTGGNITSATIQLDYVGKGPELCISTTLVTSSSCPVVTGLTGNLVDATGGSSTYSHSRSLTIGTGGSCPQNIIAQTPPSAPGDLKAVPATTTANVNFLMPTDDGGSALQDYRYSIDNGQTWVTFSPTTSGGRLQLPLTGLTPSTTYPVQIQATNARGRSVSLTGSFTTLAAGSQVAAAASTTTVAPAAPTTTTTTTTAAPQLAAAEIAPVAEVKVKQAIPQSGVNARTMLALAAVMIVGGTAATRRRRVRPSR